MEMKDTILFADVSGDNQDAYNFKSDINARAINCETVSVFIPINEESKIQMHNWIDKIIEIIDSPLNSGKLIVIGVKQNES